MQEQSYFQLISPLIFSVFAVGFFMIYSYENRLASARLFALSYFLGAIAFVCDFFRSSLLPFGFDTISNVFYMATSVTFAAAIFKHRINNSHWPVLMTLFGVSLAWIVAFSVFPVHVSVRTLTMNIFATVVFLYPVVYLWRKGGRLIDRVILALVGVSAIHFTVRAILIVWLSGAALTDENFAFSMASLTMQFTSSIAALFMAMALFFMFGMEIVISLRNNSETDPLTGVLNRRGLETRLPQFVAGLMRGVQSHAVMHVDLDHFKKINDTYGHAAGDTVLRSVVEYLRRLENSDNFIARLGGEEFAVFLYNTNESAARLAAEYVRTLIANHKHDVTNEMPVTVSIGVGFWSKERSFDRAMLDSDRALYEAKADGRNLIRIAGADMQEELEAAS